MLVIVASRYDEIALSLANDWGKNKVHLLMPENLLSVGWCNYLDGNKKSTAVINNQIIEVDSITGVLTLLPFVFPQELQSIVPENRNYIAREMTTFLAYWLNQLKCPVLNRPTPTCLMGPNWRSQQWIYAAAQIGIPVNPICRKISLNSIQESKRVESDAVTVTVVGDRCLGKVHPSLAIQARNLAHTANVDLLAVHFNSSEVGADLIAADLWVDLTSSEIKTAIWEHLLLSE